MKAVFVDGTKYDRSLIETETINKPEGFVCFSDAPAGQEELLDRIQDAEAIALGRTKIESTTLRQCKNLRLISFLGIGAGTYLDIDEATRLGILVANTPNYGVNTVAEHTLALLLAAARNLILFDRKIRTGDWEYGIEGIELRGKVLGILGLGGVGKCMARIGRALEMHVLCWTRTPDPGRAKDHGVVFVGLDELLSWSDFITIHLAFTEETRRLIGRREFALMRRNAILVNTSRGEILDTDSLVEALKEKRIRAAGIDVFDREPLENTHPLFDCDNVTLTPHVAWNTHEASVNIIRIGLNNIIEFQHGRVTNALNPVIAPQSQT